MTIKIEPKTAIAAMCNAWNKKAVGSLNGKTACRYTYADGSHCIVGAAVNIDESTNHNSDTITHLVDFGIVESSSYDFVRELRQLQVSHDKACWAREGQKDHGTVDDNNKAVEEKLRAMVEKYQVNACITPYEKLDECNATKEQ